MTTNLRHLHYYTNRLTTIITACKTALLTNHSFTKDDYVMLDFCFETRCSLQSTTSPGILRTSHRPFRDSVESWWYGLTVYTMLSKQLPVEQIPRKMRATTSFDPAAPGLPTNNVKRTRHFIHESGRTLGRCQKKGAIRGWMRSLRRIAKTDSHEELAHIILLDV